MADVPEEETPKETAETKPRRQVKRSPEGSNRNSLRSLHLLEQSYLSLIMKKPSDKITVADITREAGLNRGTFYAHFSSVPELEAYVLQELVDRFMSIGTSWFDISFVQDPEPLLKKVGAFVEEHRELIQTIRQSSATNPFTVALEQNLKRRIRDEIVHTYADDKEALTLALISTDYVMHGILSVYDSWLFGSYTDQTLDEVNEMLERLIKGTGVMIQQRDQMDAQDADAS